MKTCTRCNESKPIDQFSKGKTYQNGVRSWCKACCRETNYVHKQKAEYKAKQSERVSKLRASNPEFRDKQRLKMKEWREANVEKVRGNNVAKYGITLDEYMVMYADQNGRCKGCAKPIIAFGGTQAQQDSNAHVDHCHTTGKVRGLLCMQCNMILGAAKDSPDILASLITYLQEAA